jgi:outer membrane protein assembly factor BamA
MKKLLLITVLLVLISTKLSAQEKNIEIKKIENNQFKIVAKEEMNINLKFNLDPETNYSVLIFDKRMNKVSSRKKHKKGEFKITFSIEEGEQYTVKFIGINPIKLIPTTFAEN